MKHKDYKQLIILCFKLHEIKFKKKSCKIVTRPDIIIYAVITHYIICVTDKRKLEECIPNRFEFEKNDNGMYLNCK